MDRIAVIDVETTGLSPWRNDRIVEIAVVITAPDGTIELEYDTLVNPCRDLGPTSIHRISAADVLNAPLFADIAGDILELLRDVNAIAGHNVSFDNNFVVKEYERIGASFPTLPLLCTCRLFGRSKLTACCEELGIELAGMPHRALCDARATAKIVSFLCSEDPSLLDKHRFANVQWPSITARQTPRFCREHADNVQLSPPRFLQRIASKVRHDTEGATPNALAYLTLIDRILEDRIIDEGEESILVDATQNWQLSVPQIHAAHSQYIQNLAVSALADGVISEVERRDLHAVARLLGQDQARLDVMLDSAAAQLAFAKQPKASSLVSGDLSGQRVCFTGELQSTLGGEPITREMAETLASKSGLVVAGSVTKKLDILVVADPSSQSSKAKKAREYGTRILADVVFWKMVGVAVD